MAVSSVRNSRKYILLQKLIIIKKIGMSIANEKYSLCLYSIVNDNTRGNDRKELWDTSSCNGSKSREARGPQRMCFGSYEFYLEFKKVLKKITLYVYVSPLMTIQEERVGGHFIMQWLDK